MKTEDGGADAMLTGGGEKLQFEKFGREVSEVLSDDEVMIFNHPWLKETHDGDCTQKSHACLRCHAERVTQGMRDAFDILEGKA